MSDLLTVLDEGGYSVFRVADDRIDPGFPPTWEEFVAARRRFLDQLSRPSPPSGGHEPPGRAGHTGPGP